MDSDFLRELGVLVAFMLLYLAGSAALLRGHHTDLSAVQQGAGRRSPEGTQRAAAGGEAPVRLNRRRKAMAREQAEAAARKAPAPIPALSDED